MRGGKAYKKHKKGDDIKEGIKFSKATEGQSYARVLRLLGDRRALVFCNDGNDRIARICGALCKGPNKQIIEVGDIVLVSYREFSWKDTTIYGAGSLTMGSAKDAPVTATAAVNEKGRKDVADLMYKYQRYHWADIKDTCPDVHPRLFPTMDELSAIDTEKKKREGVEDEDVFDDDRIEHVGDDSTSVSIDDKEEELNIDDI